MRCPYCQSAQLRVIDKRDSEDSSIRRRRECIKCAKRFTTYEKIAPIEVYVIKRDGRKEEFNEEKLRKGIKLALEKRPVGEEQVEKIVRDIKARIRRKGKKEIESKDIGDMVINHLRKVDHVAYIRFASVYKGFSDVKMFEKEIKVLKR